MSTDNNLTTLSPTVMQVIEEFVAAMRADDAIDPKAIDRFEACLRGGAVPKPDDINALFFEPTQDDEP